jgi:hypothetical protein
MAEAAELDEAAQSGKALQIPIGVDAEGEPIFGAVADHLAEVDGMNDLAAQVLACATPMAMQAAAG